MEKNNKTIFLIIPLILIIVFISGCTSENQSSNATISQGPKNYSDGLTSFTYPGDWNLNTSRRDNTAGGNYLSVKDSTGDIGFAVSNPIQNTAYSACEYTKQVESRTENITDSGQITFMNNTAYYYTINYKDGEFKKIIYFDVKSGICMKIYYWAPDINTFEKNKANFDMILNSLTVNKDYNITFN